MKKAYKVLGILALVSMAVVAGRSFSTPDQAAVNCNSVKQYLNQGYTLDNVVSNAHRYLVEPTGDYEWGFTTVTLHRSVGNYSLETTYVTVKCTVQHSARGNGGSSYSVSGTDVTINTVY